MTIIQPTRKDIGEFFRLGLLARLCEPSAVVSWADSVVVAEPRPHIAFIELCLAGSQPLTSVVTLLADVPGRATLDLPIQMLLGHSWRLVATGVFSAGEILLRLYRFSRMEGDFPEDIYFTLSGYEDALCLAEDEVCGSVADLEQGFLGFLADYKAYVPTFPPVTPNPALQRTGCGD